MTSLYINTSGTYPTAASNGDYDGYVPEVLIYKEVTKEILKDLYLRQEASATFYRKANKLPILSALYSRARDNKTDNIIRMILSKERIATQAVANQYRNDESKRVEETKKIKDSHEDMLRNIYRLAIRRNRGFLEKQKVSDQEGYCLKYLDFNPNLCLIMDDCAAEIKKWGKDETISKIFYNGRHNYITSIYIFQR